MSAVADRIVRVPADAPRGEEPAGGARARPASGGLRRLGAIIAFVAILAFIGYGWLTSARVALTPFIMFRISFNSAFDSDADKFFAGPFGAGIVLADYKRATAADTDQTLLVFRLAEAANFLDRPFLYALDPKVADLFRLRDRESLYRALLERDITAVMTPDYSMPEIENSAFDPLLSDMRYAVPEFTGGGYTIFRLRPTPEAEPETRVLLDHDFGADPDLLDQWSLGESGVQLGDMLVSPPAELIVDRDGGYLELVRPGGLLSKRTLFTTLQLSPLRAEVSAFVRGQGDFTAADSVLSLSADVQGSGYVEAVIVSETEVDGVVVATNRTVVWRGILFGDERSIGGQVTLLDVQPPGVPRAQSRTAHRLFLRLRDRGYLRLHQIKVEQILGEPTSRQRAVHDIADAFDAGWWYFPSESLKNEDAIVSSADVPSGGFGLAGDGAASPNAAAGVRLRQYGGGSIAIRSPRFTWSAEQSQEWTIKLADLRATTDPVEAVVSFDLDGRGAVELLLEVACASGEPLEVLDLGPVLASAQMTTVVREAALPCLPLTASVDFLVIPDRFSLRPERGSADLTIRDLQMAVEPPAGSTRITMRPERSNATPILDDEGALPPGGGAF